MFEAEEGWCSRQEKALVQVGRDSRQEKARSMKMLAGGRDFSSKQERLEAENTEA
jgi:hypothetical protein